MTAFAMSETKPAADETEPGEQDHEEAAGLRVEPIERVLDHARDLERFQIGISV